MSFDKCFNTDAIIIWARVWLSPHSVNQANILQGVGKHLLRPTCIYVENPSFYDDEE